MLLALSSLLLTAPPAQEPPIVVKGHTWAPFISPFGEPFRARKPDEDTMADWFHQADKNGDGVITIDEMIVDAERFFNHVDKDHNGLIEPDEMVQYEWEVAPEIQLNSRWRRSPSSPAPPKAPDRDNRSDPSDFVLQGAGRYSLLNLPEPVAAADTNFDRAVSRAEFRQAAIDRFNLLDKAHKGVLTLPDLEALRPPQFVLGTHPKRRLPGERDTRVGVPLPSGD